MMRGPMTAKPGYASQILTREARRLAASDAPRDQMIGRCIATLLDQRVRLLAKVFPRDAERLLANTPLSAAISGSGEAVAPQVDSDKSREAI